MEEPCDCEFGDGGRDGGEAAVGAVGEEAGEEVGSYFGGVSVYQLCLSSFFVEIRSGKESKRCDREREREDVHLAAQTPTAALNAICLQFHPSPNPKLAPLPFPFHTCHNAPFTPAVDAALVRNAGRHSDRAVTPR